MKVKELIDFLSRVNEEAEIVIRSSCGIQWNIMEDELSKTVLTKDIKKSDKVNIRIK